MSKLYVEYYRAKEGQNIIDQEALRDYCRIQCQDLTKVSDVLTGLDRVEYYIHNEAGVVVGSFFLTAMLDMHHGKVAIMAAHWFKPTLRNNREAHRLVMWYVRRFCQTHGITKYQRTVNLSPSRQIIITKEV